MADPKIKYDIEADVKGRTEVGQLATQIEALATELDGPLKSGALASAAALRELAQKDQAISNFVTLKREAGAAADGLKQAQTAAQTLGAQLAATENPTRSQAGALQKLRDAVQAAKTEVIAKNNALAAARAGLGAYGISTEGLSQKQIAVKQALAEVRTEVASHAPAWQAAASASANSSASQSRSHRVIKEGVDSISSQLKLMQNVYAGVASMQGLGTMVKDVAATADAYNNLGARIKLVTGDGAAFTAAFDGISAVAQRTSSSLESTGNLFAKLAEAGKAMGIGQAQALELTETVNQAVQLSGASAQASDAAITQLIQGLQSGVLRGDEFNSVMEQSPRLAKALTEGLGTTTGELRKMAEAGQLTSATVIKALQNQSDAVQSEFGKLPATVGRAMTNLSTAFTAYVGEADKAGGYTAKLAGAIDTLAGNLGTVATVMIHTGQVVGGMKLLTMAQDWLTASAAIKTTAASTEVATVSTAKNTAARVENTVATNVNTAAQGRNAAAWGEVATKMGGVGPKLAAAGESAGVLSRAFGTLGGAVTGVLRAIGPLLAIDVALNFRQYGTAIGEWAAQMLGAKDRSKELEAQDKRLAEQAQASADATKKQAAATKEAAERSFGLTKEASALVVKFDEMRTKGDTASDAIGKIGKDFDLSSVPGIKNAAAVLDKLAADGKVSASEFQKAWGDALKGEDLLAFEVKAKAALEGTARGAERLAQINEAILRESVNRVADTYNVLAQKSSAAATSAINDTELMIKGLDKLKAQGVDTAAALTASIGKGINTASTQKDLDTIKTQIEQVRKVLGDKVANGLLDQAKQKAEELRQKLEDLTPGIQSAKEAMRQLGITSDAELKKVATSAQAAYDALKDSGTASARELQQAFQKAAQAAIDANNGVAPSWVTAQAATRGYRIEVDEAGKSTLILASASKKVEDSMRGQAAATDTATSALERQIQAQEKANQLAERAADLERKRRGVDKEGFSTDKNGNRLVAGSDLGTLTGIASFLKSAGVADEAVARNIAREFADEKGNVIYANTPGQRKYGGDTLSVALLKAAETYTFGIGSNAKQTGVGQQPSTIPAQPAKTYNVTIGSQTVRTVSDADAQTLMALLAQAQRAA